MSQIFIYRDGKNEGPYSLEQVRAALIIGTLIPDNWAWYEGIPNWIPLSPVVAQLAQDKQHEAGAWRRKVATADQKAELRFLSITVKRDLTQGTCQDLINEACKNPTIRFKLELFRLKRKKEKEFSEFLLKNSFKLGIVNPTMAQLCETIDLLQDNIADWAAQTSAAEFATLILSRYPELKGNWEYPVADNSNIFDSNDDPATKH